jgi:hypothetical protein
MLMTTSAASTGRLAAALCALALTLPLPARAQTRPAAADSAVLVTRLGKDTLAVERIVRAGRRVEAEVVLRVPTVSRTRYVLETTAEGGVLRLEAVALDPRGSEVAGGRELTVRAGDSLRVESTVNGEKRTRTVAAEAASLPFIDMVHWPFELALMRARAAGGAEVVQPMLTGARTSPFRLGKVGNDSMTITHPSRGTMRVKVDALGRLLALDAGATTRKLIVERRPWMAVEPFAERWAAEEAAGRKFGDLSGRGKEESTVKGAHLTVDYGTPAKRGREIWGALVPYGEVWRTGANMATHFTTDRDLVLGSGSNTLSVPAGSYTLFSIPARDGGVLIVSRQTGQTGTAYNAERDLGRVKLTARPLAEEVELFTIRVSESGQGGELRLQWDRTELVVPFIVVAR